MEQSGLQTDCNRLTIISDDCVKSCPTEQLIDVSLSNRVPAQLFLLGAAYAMCADFWDTTSCVRNSIPTTCAPTTHGERHAQMQLLPLLMLLLLLLLFMPHRIRCCLWSATIIACKLSVLLLPFAAIMPWTCSDCATAATRSQMTISFQVGISQRPRLFNSNSDSNYN